jgi:organic radical activating enzyme
MPLTLATIAPGQPEIFASIQGEGPTAGEPALFVRLSRCNLACRWCDTAYTWRFEGDARPHRDDVHYARADNQVVLSEADVAERILALGGERLVVTGGEPLLQAGPLARMLALLKVARPALHVEVETNGTVCPPGPLDELVDQYNVSPKLGHSGNARDLAQVPERLAAFAADARAFFKFVVAAPDDLAEVAALQQAYAIAAERLFVMPEGTDSASLRERTAWLAGLAAERGWRTSDRAHIHRFGDTRGT